MSELALNADADVVDDNWTDKRCIEFITDFERRRAAVAGTGSDYTKFMDEHRGTFPPEVIDFIWRQPDGDFERARAEGRATCLPAGELAIAHPSSRPPMIPGVEIVAIDD